MQPCPSPPVACPHCTAPRTRHDSSPNSMPTWEVADSPAVHLSQWLTSTYLGGAQLRSHLSHWHHAPSYTAQSQGGPESAFCLPCAALEPQGLLSPSPGATTGTKGWRGIRASSSGTQEVRACLGAQVLDSRPFVPSLRIHVHQGRPLPQNGYMAGW